MKTIVLATACLMALTGVARAENAAISDYLEFHPYVGADFQHSEYSYNNNYLGTGADLNDFLESGLNGGNIHVGNRFNKFLGVELGYFYDAPGKQSGAGYSTKLRGQGGTLDALGYLPLGPENKFDLIGTAGATWTKAKLDIDIPALGSASADKGEWGWRAGGGVQFHLTPHWNLRGLVRYQSADFDDIADHAITYTAGLNYEF